MARISERASLASSVVVLMIIFLVSLEIHAAEPTCPYVTLKPSLKLENGSDVSLCIFSREHREGYYWLMVIPITEKESRFLQNNMYSSRPPINPGEWNEVGGMFYYPAKDLLILASNIDNWFDLSTRIKFSDKRPHLSVGKRLKPFPIPNEEIWRQVQKISPGEKYAILSHELDCVADELRNRKFIGSAFGDFNGDGKQDIAFHTINEKDKSTFWIFHSSKKGFKLIVRRENFGNWVLSSKDNQNKMHNIILAGGCQKGDSSTMKFDNKTGKYMFFPPAQDPNEKPIIFESGIGTPGID